MCESCCGGRAEFVPDCLYGHKNSPRERAVESPGSGTSERERAIGKQSRNSDRCALRLDERERGAQGRDAGPENKALRKENIESKTASGSEILTVLCPARHLNTRTGFCIHRQ